MQLTPITDFVQRRSPTQTYNKHGSINVLRQINEIFYLLAPDRFHLYSICIRKCQHQQSIQRRTCHLALYSLCYFDKLLVSDCRHHGLFHRLR